MTAKKRYWERGGGVCGQLAEPGIFLATEIFKWERFCGENNLDVS